MKINLVSLFPEFFSGPLSCGLLQRALEASIVSIATHNPRDKATDRHGTVDGRPYGGGPGMVMLPGPLSETLHDVGFALHKPAPTGSRLIYLSPKGKPLTHALAAELAKENELTLICGRYEGIDARLETLFPVEPISVGDFVLNGGETAALCLVESVARLLPGFMGHEASGEDESFANGLLEYPHYTRPEVFAEKEVPQVLRSGNHAAIMAWRREKALQDTLAQRPDLLDTAPLTPQDRLFLQTQTIARSGRNLYCALVHYPVLDKSKKSVAVSLTNLDIHDIARSSCTFGLGGYYIVTPIKDQQALLSDILQHWTTGAGGQSNPDRNNALSLVHGVDSLEESIAAVKKSTGQDPLIIGTTACIHIPKRKKKLMPYQEMSFAEVRKILEKKPVLLLFGTGHGLAPEVHALCDAFTPPVRWHGEYNHLSVRAAAAIIFDRILGDWY